MPPIWYPVWYIPIGDILERILVTAPPTDVSLEGCIRLIFTSYTTLTCDLIQTKYISVQCDGFMKRSSSRGTSYVTVERGSIPIAMVELMLGRWYTIRWFWICAKPMRDGVNLQRRLSLAGCKPRSRFAHSQCKTALLCNNVSLAGCKPSISSDIRITHYAIWWWLHGPNIWYEIARFPTPLLTIIYSCGCNTTHMSCNGYWEISLVHTGRE